jgi:hypothetical protein
MGCGCVAVVELRLGLEDAAHRSCKDKVKVSRYTQKGHKAGFWHVTL